MAVALFEISKGAQRWLDIGVARIQPSELMRSPAPLMLAGTSSNAGDDPCPRVLVAGALLLLPVGLIVKQPDLGTALLVAAAGFYVCCFSPDCRRKLILPVAVVAIVGINSLSASATASASRMSTGWCSARLPEEQGVIARSERTHWARVFTSSVHHRDRLRRVLGKGWQAGTGPPVLHSRAAYHDFIFAVLGEFSLTGALVLLALCLLSFCAVCDRSAGADAAHPPARGRHLAMIFSPMLS